MARKNKEGLDYFPLDIDFFDDEKIAFVSAQYEELGELIAVKLLGKIYRNGYFINWSEDMCLLFASKFGNNITPELLQNVVDELIKRQFFSEKKYTEHKILTSKGIQEQYLLITRRRKKNRYM